MKEFNFSKIARGFKKRLINVLMLINKQPITAEIVCQ